MYNPFHDIPFNNFYTGKVFEYNIYCYKSTLNTNEVLFVLENENTLYYYKTDKLKRMSKELTEFKLNKCNYTEIGMIKYCTGLPRDRRIFDENCPKIPETLGLDRFNEYDTEHQITKLDGKVSDINNNSVPVIRNNQILGHIPLGKKMQYGKQHHNETNIQKIQMIHKIEYVTFSNQDNPFDDIMGVQDNKNQYIPDVNFTLKPLVRLVNELRKRASGEIFSNFKKTLRNFKLLNIFKKHKPHLNWVNIYNTLNKSDITINTLFDKKNK